MKIERRVIVFDARDIEAESRFWAGLLGGLVHRDEQWHSIVVDGEWVMGVQLAPNQVTPDWPSGPQQQQVHLDLHVDDLEAAERLAVELGGHLLQTPKQSGWPASAGYSAKASGLGQEQTRCRSPYAPSTRPTGAQYLSTRTSDSG